MVDTSVLGEISPGAHVSGFASESIEDRVLEEISSDPRTLIDPNADSIDIDRLHNWRETAIKLSACKNPLEVLGYDTTKPKAVMTETSHCIQSRCRKLLLRYHPDKLVLGENSPDSTCLDDASLATQVTAHITWARDEILKSKVTPEDFAEFVAGHCTEEVIVPDGTVALGVYLAQRAMTSVLYARGRSSDKMIRQECKSEALVEHRQVKTITGVPARVRTHSGHKGSVDLSTAKCWAGATKEWSHSGNTAQVDNVEEERRRLAWEVISTRARKRLKRDLDSVELGRLKAAADGGKYTGRDRPTALADHRSRLRAALKRDRIEVSRKQRILIPKNKNCDELAANAMAWTAYRRNQEKASLDPSVWRQVAPNVPWHHRNESAKKKKKEARKKRRQKRRRNRRLAKDASLSVCDQAPTTTPSSEVEPKKKPRKRGNNGKRGFRRSKAEMRELKEMRVVGESSPAARIGVIERPNC